LLDLTDRRGECIHAACAHFRRCFVERAVRKSRSAHLVVANHALMLTSLARGGDPSLMPRRLVFDEGHHLFEAADSAFSLVISGREGAMMRRWILGAERSGSGRARGLAARIGELTDEDREAAEFFDALIHAASCLPGPGWRSRVQKLQAKGPGEDFLVALRGQVIATASPGRYSLEAPATAPGSDLCVAATAFEAALGQLARAISGLARRLQAMLDEEAQNDDPGHAGDSPDPRAAAAIRGLTQRATSLNDWRGMLIALLDSATAEPDSEPAATPAATPAAAPATHVDWLAVSRADGREIDYGLHRHWLDPTEPLAEIVLEPADGVIVTSATLRDEAQADHQEEGWQNAESRVGGHHLVEPPRRASFDSPFDYAAQTRVFVVTDVNKKDPAAVAAAYGALFLASRGGALGIFTAIERLKAVQRAIVAPLEKADLLLLAQHVDPMDTGTLVDIFRAEEHACLLGTDAVRDGIDVPGRSLRLIVFDRVPWPRPTILHRARRAHFGGRGYDESLTRLRLKQAFGRLIRGQEDHGVFVILDVATPSRLLPAFPPGVIVERVPLADAVAGTAEFLGT
jgi:ATP-dependent DNA helicase DinG